MVMNGLWPAVDVLEQLPLAMRVFVSDTSYMSLQSNVRRRCPRECRLGRLNRGEKPRDFRLLLDGQTQWLLWLI